MRQIAVTLLLLAAVLSACSSASTPLAPTIQPAAGEAPPAASAQAPTAVGSAAPAAGADSIVITFGAQEYERQVYQPLIDAFNEQNPDLRVQFVSLDEIFNSGAGQNQVFDPNAMMRRIVSAADTAAYWSVSPDMVKNGYVHDLKPLIDADAAFPLDEYPAALLAPYTQGDALHGLPQAVNFRMLMYNPQAFERAGLEPPTIDWTIDEFVNAAQQLTSGQGDSKQFGYVSLGGQTSDLVFFIQQAGASMITGSGDTVKPNFTDAKVIQAIRGYLDLLKNASPHEKITGYGRGSSGEDSYNLVSQGRAGMWFDYGWSFGFGGPDQAFKPAMAPLPLGGRSLAPEDMSVRGLHISAGAENPAACWSWIKHLSSQAGTFDGSFPAHRSLLDDAAFAAQLPEGAADVYKAYSDILEQAPQAAGASKPYYMSKIDFYWLFRAVDRAMQGQDLERELEDAQALTEQFVACVAGDTNSAECAKQVDPEYDGWQSVPETAPGDKSPG